MAVPAPAPFNDRLSFDRTLDTYIEFPTCSDAMLASLGLAHGVDSKVMDAIFAIVQNAHFDPAELTLRSTEDVYLHVAKRRCRETVLLTHRGFSECAAFGVLPQPILEGVVDVISDELEHVSRAFTSGMPIWYGRDAKRAAALRKDLLSMCLVQRSWLQPVRRALGRCLELVNPSRDTLMRSLRQPLVGPWTRHLSIVALEDSEENEPADLVKPLQKLLSERLTSVLSMSLTVRRRDVATFAEILDLLPLVREFKLEVYPKGSDCFPVPTALFSAFASLPRLEHLSLKLSKWSPAGLSPDALPAELAPVAHSPHLLSVHLYGHAPAERLSWIRAANSVFHLRTLEKDFGRKGRPTREYPFSSLEPTTALFTHLSDLRLRVPESGNIALPRLLPHSTALHQLYFEADDFPSPAALASIPASTVRLGFQFSIDFRRYPDADREPWVEFDQRLLAYLMGDRAEKLESLRVYMRPESEGFLVRTKSGYRFRVMEEIKLPRSERLCRERGIEWRFTHEADRLQGHWFD